MPKTTIGKRGERLVDGSGAGKRARRIGGWLSIGLSSAFLMLVGIVLAAGGGYLLVLGGSPYYLVAGAMTFASGALLFKRRLAAARVYGVLLAMTIVWSLWEAGPDPWGLAPRLAGPLVIWMFFLLAPLPRNASHGRRGRRAFTAAAAMAVLLALVVLVPAWCVPADSADSADVPHAWSSAADGSDGDWLHWGRTAGGDRFSPLAQITPANVEDLELAWTARLGMPDGGVPSTLEVTPLKIGNTLYACNGANRVSAIEATSGKLIWRFDPKVDPSGLLVGTCRGVAYYRDPGMQPGEGACAERIVTATVDARLLAIDARTGRPCPGFGRSGSVDLSRRLGKVDPGYYHVTSAPTIVRGRIVLGGWITDNQSVGEPSGVVRAFDVRSGAFAWAWDMGRSGRTGEPGAQERYTPGTPNSWAPASADEALGLVYLPMGNPTPDFWGGARTPEMDRYGSAVVALDIGTGLPRWSFQTTHHDLWDYDLASQPTLVDWRMPNGAAVPALIQPTKRGEFFVLDRRDGRPLVPVTERPVPGGPAPGDRLSPTQPYPAMPSLAGKRLAESDMWGLTPIDQLWCRIQFRKARYDGEFTPPGLKPTIQYPGYVGGSNWGSATVDPERNLLIASVNHFANYGRLITRAEADAKRIRIYRGGDFKGGEEALSKPQVGTPFAAEFSPFASPLGVPCQKPPYGELVAIDLATRAVAWRRPLGTARDSGPLGLAIRLDLPMGPPNLGGAITTHSGLTFVGASQERAFRAFDSRTGRELWKRRLPASANAIPMTYLGADGRQYVVIAAGGSPMFGGPLGDYLIAYRISKD